MSKAFTKEDSAEAPPEVVRRPALPPGVVNYVTPRGLGLLRAELSQLQAERARTAATSEEPERSRALARLQARQAELEARLATMVPVDPATQPRGEVRFGARVTVRTSAGDERRYHLVGVDEADAAQGLVAFVAPLARALIGRRVGDVALLKTPRGEEELEVLAIDYEPPAP